MVGLKDVVVVATADAVLVTAKRQARARRNWWSASRPAIAPRSGASAVYRPWGFYQTNDVGSRYQVKRICVNPGGRLSLQRHFHRSEHWVVVRGVAEVTVGEEVQARP